MFQCSENIDRGDNKLPIPTGVKTKKVTVQLRNIADKFPNFWRQSPHIKSLIEQVKPSIEEAAEPASRDRIKSTEREKNDADCTLIKTNGCESQESVGRSVKDSRQAVIDRSINSQEAARMSADPAISNRADCSKGPQGTAGGREAEIAEAGGGGSGGPLLCKFIDSSGQDITRQLTGKSRPPQAGRRSRNPLARKAESPAAMEETPTDSKPLGNEPQDKDTNVEVVFKGSPLPVRSTTVEVAEKIRADFGLESEDSDSSYTAATDLHQLPQQHQPLVALKLPAAEVVTIEDTSKDLSDHDHGGQSKQSHPSPKKSESSILGLFNSSGPKVQVAPVNSLNFQEVFEHRRRLEDAVGDSDQDSDHRRHVLDSGSESAADDESSDNETAPTPTASKAWSSLSLILEPEQQQLQSVQALAGSAAKKKSAEKKRKQQQQLVKPAKTSEGKTASAEEQSRGQQLSAVRSGKRKSRLRAQRPVPDTGTDTDDQRPVSRAGRSLTPSVKTAAETTTTAVKTEVTAAKTPTTAVKTPVATKISVPRGVDEGETESTTPGADKLSEEPKTPVNANPSRSPERSSNKRGRGRPNGSIKKRSSDGTRPIGGVITKTQTKMTAFLSPTSAKKSEESGPTVRSEMPDNTAKYGTDPPKPTIIVDSPATVAVSRLSGLLRRSAAGRRSNQGDLSSAGETSDLEGGRSARQRSASGSRADSRSPLKLSVCGSSTPSHLLLLSSDTEGDCGSRDAKQDAAKETALGPPLYSLGDIVWVRIGSHPFWPAMVTNDPVGPEPSYRREKQRSGGKGGGWSKIWEYHVGFFGEPNRAWVGESRMAAFRGRQALRQIMEEKGSSKRFTALYSPKPGSKEKWEASVDGAEALMRFDASRRLKEIAKYNRYLGTSPSTASKRKRSLSETSGGGGVSSSSEMPSSKRSELEAGIAAIVKTLDLSSYLEEGKQHQLTGYLLFKLGRRRNIRDPSVANSLQQEQKDKRAWEELPSMERRLYIEAKKNVLQQMETAEGKRRSMACQRQQEMKAKLDEKEKKKAEAGPAWWYEPVGAKGVIIPSPSAEAKTAEGGNAVADSTPAATAPVLLGQFRNERCCIRCEEPTVAELGSLQRCRGCQNSYHAACLGQDSAQHHQSGEEEDKWRCPDCLAGIHPCFICKFSEGEVLPAATSSKQEGENSSKQQPLRAGPVRKCTAGGSCGKWYHEACLSANGLWPQARVGNSTLTCPAHICHTCASEDTRNPVMKYSEKLIKCVRCPTAYHGGDYCVAAGTVQITKTDMVCPKHYEPPLKGKKSSHHVNTSWCFMCSKGGSLICCEACPSSFHVECLNTEPPEGKYYCDNCESGRMPLYDEIVWVKVGAYRWWPAVVLHPTKVPDNIEKLKHQMGEFPIQFLGTNDYYWINQGRAFLYEEGDSERVPAMSSKTMDASFRKGIIEAERLFREYQRQKAEREQKQMARVRKSNSGKPAPYVKLKTNKPFGSCPVYTVDPEDVQPCDCDPGKLNPCGEESNCLNRMLMFECHMQVCLAKERCGNMRFQKRQYPDVKIVQAEGRGWGLVAQQHIKKGEFVIEYVGELITMEEYRNRMASNQESKEENYYYLTIDNNRMIDAGPKGNLARFMNHSCDPNCITQKWTVNGDTRVGLFTLRDVEPGTELTFNYQLESVGDIKKKCLCGAKNCSGYIGEKPKTEKEERKREQELHKKKDKLKKKKENNKKTTGEKPKEDAKKKSKIWESNCFRCHEGGSLIRCQMGLCPKSYHLACIGKDMIPRGRWQCPWHYCAACGKLVEGGPVEKAWCLHCPNAYCKVHRGALTAHPELGLICDQHEDEFEFLLDTMRAGPGIAELFPCPEPTAQQLQDWKTAKGIKDTATIDTSLPITASGQESATEPQDKPKKSKSRFSVDLGESSTETSRSGMTSRSETPSNLVPSNGASSRSVSPSVSLSSASCSASPPPTAEETKKTRRNLPGVRRLPDASTSRERKNLAADVNTTAVTFASLPLEAKVPKKISSPGKTKELRSPETPQPGPKKGDAVSGSAEGKRPRGRPPSVGARQLASPTAIMEKRPEKTSDRPLLSPQTDQQQQQQHSQKATAAAAASTPARSRLSRSDRKRSASEQPKRQLTADSPRGSPSALTATAAAPPLATTVVLAAAATSQPELEDSFPEFLREEMVVWKCYDTSCSYQGTDDHNRMQNHLRYHGLPPVEVARLAGNILAISTQLRMARRTSYRHREDGRQMGAGPQTFIDGPAVADYSKYDCLAASECSMKFDSEQTLLRHCRLVHCDPTTAADTSAANISLPLLFASPPPIRAASPFRTPAAPPAALVSTPVAAFTSPQKATAASPSAPAAASISAVERTSPQKPVSAVAALSQLSPPPAVGPSPPDVGRRSARRSAVSERFQLAAKQQAVSPGQNIEVAAAVDSDACDTESPQRLRYRCLIPGCERIIQGTHGSMKFKEHWLSHQGAVFQYMKYVDVETGSEVKVDEIYPFSGQCDACQQIFISTRSLTDVVRNVKRHWGQLHTDQSAKECSYSTLTYRRSLPAKLPLKEESKSTKDETIDPLDLEGPFRCEVVTCREVLQDALTVFRHVREVHSEDSIQDGFVMHVATGRIFLNVSLYRHVLECGFIGCTAFVGRNSSLEDAQAILKTHWMKFHKKSSLKDFCYDNLSLEHDPLVVPKSQDEPVPRDTSTKPAGPFVCTALQCEFKCNAVSSMTRHWNMAHTEVADQAACLDTTTCQILTLYDIFLAVVQCKICKAVSCSTLGSKEAVGHIFTHLRKCHPDSYAADTISEQFDVLKDEKGRAQPAAILPDRMEENEAASTSLTDPAAEEPLPARQRHERPHVGLQDHKQPELEMASFRLLQSQGLINNGREMVSYSGPFHCLGVDGCRAMVPNNKLVLRHWNLVHRGLEKFSMLDEGTGSIVNCHDMYKCLGACPRRDCGLVIGLNSSYEGLKFRIKHHMMKHHDEDPGTQLDFMVLVPPDVNEEEENFTIAEYKEILFSRVHRGPYLCLSPGCDFVSQEAPVASSKQLMDHWVDMQHGTIEEMLFMDINSRTVLNVKVICGRVAICQHPGCLKYIPSTYRRDLGKKVGVHWSKEHPGIRIPANVADVYLETELTDPLYVDTNIVRRLLRARRQAADGPAPLKKKRGRKPKVADTTLYVEGAGITNEVDTRVHAPNPLGHEAASYTAEPETEAPLAVDADDTADEIEDDIEYDGPFQCSCCNTQIPLSASSNKKILQHWTARHGDARQLEYTDIPTGERLILTNFYSTVIACSVYGCSYAQGSNRGHSTRMHNVRSHWIRHHPDLPLPDTDEQLYRQVAMDDDILSVVTTDSNVVDLSVIPDGPFQCTVDDCGTVIDQHKKTWRMNCLNHFLEIHVDKLINHLRFKDLGTGRIMKIQHFFAYVGQCNETDCHMIKGVNGRNRSDGNYELNRQFIKHFISEHPGREMSLSILVGYHEVLFITEEQAEQCRNSSTPAVIGSQKPRKRKSTALGTSLNAKIKQEPSEPEVVTPAKKRRRSQTAVLSPQRPFALAAAVAMSPLTESPNAQNKHRYKCWLCGAGPKTLKPGKLAEHWNQIHRTSQPLLMPRFKCGKTREILQLTQIFSHVGQCQEEGCGYICCADAAADLSAAGRQHYDVSHPGIKFRAASSLRSLTEEVKQEVGLFPTLPSTSRAPAKGLQCMAGYGTGEPHCTSMVAADPGHLNAVRHWQAKHRGLRMRELLFMDTASEQYVQLSDIYNTACTCASRDCQAVAYIQLSEDGDETDPLSPVEAFFAAHGQRAHNLSSCAFKRLACSEYLADRHRQEESSCGGSNIGGSNIGNNHNPNEEEVIIDAKLRREVKKKNNPRKQKIPPAAATTTGAAANSPPIDNSVRGYKCAVGSCHKVFMVSSIQGPSVAISRLKNHFNIKHQSLGSDSFACEAFYTSEEGVAASSPAAYREDSESSLSGISKTPPKNKSPAVGRRMKSLGVRTPVAKSPLAAAAIDSPGDHELSRMYSCGSKGCNFKHSMEQVIRQHFEQEHNSNMKEAAGGYAFKQCRTVGGGRIRTASGSRQGEEPMVPVGRRPGAMAAEATSLNQAVTSLSQPEQLPGASRGFFRELRCGYVGCDFISGNKRDLARHRRENRHSKLSRRTSSRVVHTTGGLSDDDDKRIFRCQMAGCNIETVGEARMEDHWEADHKDRLVEEWIYEEVTVGLNSSSATSNVKRKREEEQSSPAAYKTARLDVSGNFEMAGLGETNGDGSTSDSDDCYNIEYAD